MKFLETKDPRTMFNCARGKIERLPINIMKMFLLIKDDSAPPADYSEILSPKVRNLRPFCNNPFFVIDPYERTRSPSANLYIGSPAHTNFTTAIVNAR